MLCPIVRTKPGKSPSKKGEGKNKNRKLYRSKIRTKHKWQESLH